MSKDESELGEAVNKLGRSSRWVAEQIDWVDQTLCSGRGDISASHLDECVERLVDLSQKMIVDAEALREQLAALGVRR